MAACRLAADTVAAHVFVVEIKDLNPNQMGVCGKRCPPRTLEVSRSLADGLRSPTSRVWVSQHRCSRPVMS